MTSFNGTMSYEGEQPSDALTQQAIRLAVSTRQMKEAADLPRMIKAYDLPDGDQVYVLDMEHTWRVHIIRPHIYQTELPELPDPEDVEGSVAVPIAGVLSGACYTGTMDFEEIDWPVESEVPLPGVPQGVVPIVINHSFSLVTESAELFPKPEASHKLAVPPYVTHSTLGDETLRTQFRHIIPGRYTGAMSAIVQLLLGVGRLVTPDYEERWRELNESRGLAGTVTREVPPDGDIESVEAEEVDSFYFRKGEQVQISYDYRWNRTHGVMWAQGNDGKRKPMLVELAQRGIHVMPFPVDELSKYDEVQDYYQQVYPKLAQYTPFRGRSETLFEAFNGFPTGENMPGYFKEFDKWKRAGLIIGDSDAAKLFYDGSISICTAFGWAFHPSQPKAINTAYRYENGHKVGVCYEVYLDITEKADSAKIRNSVTGQVIIALGLSGRVDRYKAARLPQSFAESLLDEPDYDTFDEFEVSPDWIVSARMSQVREGIIDYPANQCPGVADHVEPPFWMVDRFFGPRGGFGTDPCAIISSPKFFYYEPMLGEVLNFDFSNLTWQGERYVSDGPIFATYRDSGVEILNYHHEPADMQAENINTRQPCQYTGIWEDAHYSQGTQLVGYFYCSSRDFRKKIAIDSGWHQKTTGQRTGHADFIGFCAFFGVHSTSSRHFFGTQNWERESWSSQQYHVSVTASANNRSAFLVCWEQSKRENRKSRGFSGRQMLGSSGTILRGTIYNWLWHWVGCASWSCPTTDSPCIHRICETVTTNPNSCHGVDPPSTIRYSVCPVSSNGGAGPYTIISPVGPGNIIVSAYYTPLPESPPSWSEHDDPVWEFEWEVWAFGLDLMNNIRVNKGKEVITDPQAVPQRASYTGWWRCAIPNQCPGLPWYVGMNFFGRKHVTAYNDLFPGKVVDFGAELSVGFGPTAVPFGVLD